MKTTLLSNQAKEHIAKKQYKEAETIYNTLSQRIGDVFYEFNIKHCKKLKEITESPPKTIIKNTEHQETDWIDIEVIGGEKIEITAKTTYESCKENIKKAILLIQIVDKYGNPIQPDQKQFKATYSPALATHFYYLNDSNEKTINITTITIPEKSKKLFLKATEFGTNKAEKIFTEITIKRAIQTTTKIEITPNKKASSQLKNKKIAFIADEFTFNSYKDEFTPIVIEPNNWRELLEEHKPEVFFCESAWSGVDSIKRPWKGQVYASTAFNKENRTQLLEIIKYCKKEGIATIFWNKEDPTHYSDKKHDFTKTANEFDYIFTSAEECVDQYKKEYNRTNVYPLAFASNPRIFNPIESTPNRTNNIVFAGSWYENHVERCHEMNSMFGTLIAMGFDLEIYDRHFQSSDPLHIWPEHLRKYLHPSITHEQTAALYKSSHYGLNINTVKTSKTMFARRVFELITSNTTCITNHSPGVELMFSDSVIFEKNLNDLKDTSENDLNKQRRKAMEIALSKHTYRNRWNEICETIGKKQLQNNIKKTHCILIDNFAEAESSLSWHQINKNSTDDLLLIASEKFPVENIGDLYQKYNKYGMQATSLHYMKNYGDESISIIEPDQHALLFDIKRPPTKEQIRRAENHTQYTNELSIKISDKDIYKYYPKQCNPINTISHTEKFTRILFALVNNTEINCIEV